jgi:endonuclease YncB( thermonuclease family)
MRRYFLAVILCALAGVAVAETLTGLIVGVTDGDTLTLLDDSKQQHKIRLDGIDAPEKAQPFGNRSKQSLALLAFDHRAEATCPKTDRYGRQVCKVTVGGADVALEQIRRGMAWHFKRYEKEQRLEDREAYAAAEIEARQAGRGLWRDRNPVPPWEWRAGRRKPQPTAASSPAEEEVIAQQ